MNKITTLAVAGALALSAVGATATTASAKDGWRNGGYNPGPQYHQRHRGGGNNNGGALAAGAIFGLAVGALAGQAFGPPVYYAPVPTYYPPQPVYYPPQPVYAGPVYGNPNSSWCAQQYRSYNPQTNTWVDFQGVVHVCYGPY